MNVQDEIKALKQRIAELEEQVKEEQGFPQDGDTYWYIDDEGMVYDSEFENIQLDRNSLKIGNLFQTKEEAEFVLEKLKVEAELRKFSRPFEYGQPNFNIILPDNESFSTAYWNEIQNQGSIYFESEEKAQQAIESVGKERIKKYIFGVEE